MKKQLYQARIAKNDSVTNVVYDNVLHVWFQGDLLVLQRGTRGKDRDYIYYPANNIDHVHVIEQHNG